MRLTAEERPDRGPAALAPARPTPTPFNLNRPVWRLVLALAMPALAQQYLLLLVRLSDHFLAGHLDIPDKTLLKQYQAAMTTAGYLYWFVSSYTILVSVGGTALVARFFGAGDSHAANHALGQSVFLAGLFGLLGTLAAITGLPTLLEILHLTGPAANFGLQFLTPLALLLPFQMVESACVACLAGAGDTRTGLFVLGGVAILNLPLAWMLCYGLPGVWPGLGFVGIALGTGLSHVTGALVVVALLLRGRSGLCLTLRQLKPDLRLIYRLLRISLPAGVDSLSVGVCQLWFLSLVNELGDVAAAAHGIALLWEALGYLAGGAFGTAAMTLVGQYLGAGQPERSHQAGWTALALGGGVMVGMGLIFITFAWFMFRLFCPEPAQMPIIEVGVPVLRLVAFAMPGLASGIILTAALRGAGDTRVPVLFTWIGFLGVRIPLTYLLTRPRIDLGPLGEWPGFPLGLYGAWVAMFVDIYVRGGLVTLRFIGGKWKSVNV